MNKKMTLTDLAEALSGNREISENFLREFINVLVKNLKEDNTVKLKNFGVFKVVKVGERESVDVNTGEKIIIPAHQKITFSPDKKLKESVNKPFELFEPVLLGEGVEIDMSDVESLRKEVSEDITTISQEKSASKADERIEAPIIPSIPSGGGGPRTLLPDPMGTSARGASMRPKRGDNLLYMICVAVVLLLGVGFYYYVIRGDDVQLEDATVLQPDSAMLLEEDSLAFENTDTSVVAYDTAVSDEVPQGASVVEKVEQERMQQIAQEEAAKREQAAQERAKLVADRKSNVVTKEQIRQEAAKATSSAAKQPSTQSKSVVVKAGDTFRTLALQHYGSKDFWGYIYQANKGKVKSPNSLSQGVTLVIPSAASLGIDANNPASISKAKALGAKLK